MRFHAKYVSVGEFGDEYFEVSFDSEVPSDNDFDLSGPHHPYLIVQRQFEDDDATGRINAVRLAHQRALGNPFDSIQPEHALAGPIQHR